VFIKKLHANLKEESPSAVAISHFVFTLSHSCLKMLIHLDSLENKMKATRIDDEEKGSKNRKKANNKNEEEEEEELDKVVGGMEAEI
jgi:hypothetical protein